METKYIPSEDFVEVCRNLRMQGALVELRDVDGHARWFVTENGEEYIIRPSSTKDE